MSAPGRERPALRHDGIFYDDETVLASTAVSFVREGVDRGETVMVNTGPHPVTALLHAVFGDEEQVVFAEREVYGTPVSALDAYRRTMDHGLAAGAVGYRGIGFIDFETTWLPWQEWLRYEAAVNHVFEGYPFQTLCPYDVTRVEPRVIEAMRRAHTGLVDADGWRPNDGYVAPADLVLDDDLLPPRHRLQDTPPRMVLEPGGDLVELRMELYSATMFTDLPRRKVDDFVAAASELVANARKHGAPPVTMRLWAGGEGVLCTVTDRGPGIEDALAGYARAKDPNHGLGLWAVRQLCDTLDFARDEHGFTVRAASFL